MTAPASGDEPVVSIEVPADVVYVGVVRSLAAGLAARLPFTVDEIDDLRIAVDEAFALLMPLAVAGSTVRTGFRIGTDSIEVSVDVASSSDATLDQGGFGWTVLEALAHVADVRDGGGSVGLTLHKDAEETASLSASALAEPAAP